MTRIGIIEDDRLLNEALCTYLETLGYITDSAFSFEEGMALADKHPDLLLADIGLADGSGIEICRMVRGKTPVIFLTAKDGEEDMLRAFGCGADDYLVKPFPMPVLAAHIQAVLRRTGGSRNELHYLDMHIDYDKKQVQLAGSPVKLTPREYQLLELLSQNRGKVVTKDMILEKVWDSRGVFVDDNTVNVTLNRLKKKIEPDPSHPLYIRNIFGLGYTFGE